MIAAGILFLMMADVARADSAEARKHYDRGMKAFNLQKADVALREFQAAYVELPDAAFLFNIGQAQRQLGQYEAAARSYRLYLANQADSPNREQVRRLIEQMDQAAAVAHAKTPPTGTQPPTGAVAQQAPPPSQPAAVALVDTGRPMRTAGIITADVGLGLVAVGVVFAVLSKNAGDDAYRPSSGVYDHAADLRQTNFRSADITCFVVGGAGIVAGTTVWLLGRGRRSSVGAGISPAVSASGVGVSF